MFWNAGEWTREARDYWRWPAASRNNISDVPGVRVGHYSVIGKRTQTGVTVIMPHEGNLFQDKVPAAVDTFNGFGKACGFEQVRELGRLETPIALTNTLCVPRVADTLINYTLKHNPGATSINPVVGECNDSYLNDITLQAVNEWHVFQAIDLARESLLAEGCIGAGKGTACYGFKGGIGTASRKVGSYVLGALAQTNFGQMHELMIFGRPVGMKIAKDRAQPPTPPGSVIIVLATNAPLSSLELGRMAKRAMLGLARTGARGHHGSGDFTIAFSTANRYAHAPADPVETIERVSDLLLDDLFSATVEAVENCVYNALFYAETTEGRDGHVLERLPWDIK
jgi:D-aminopeptidase